MSHNCTPAPKWRQRVWKIRSWLRWNLQGRPTQGPVVLRRGELLIQSNGTRCVKNWVLDLQHMEQRTSNTNELWGLLANKFPETIRWESERAA